MQQYAELYHLSSLNSLQQLIVSLMNIIKYFRRKFNTNSSKKRPHWLTEMKIISLERTEFNDTPNNEVKNDEASSFILNFLAAIQNATFRHSYQLLSSLQRTCMHAQSGHSPNETISCVLGGLPDLDQGIIELLDHLSCKLGGGQMDWNMSQSCSIGFRWG